MKGIRNKILKKTLAVVVASLTVCILISYFAIDNISKNADITNRESSELAAKSSSGALVEQATAQAVEYTESASLAIRFKMQGIISALEMVSGGITDIYQTPDNYLERPYKHPKDSPADTFCMQWVLPEGVEMSGDIERETYLLGNTEILFANTLSTYSNILSVYYTSSTGINIGYDDTAQTKPEYYDGRNTGWFTHTKESGALYISEPYADSFGRGFMITAAVPCIGDNGEFYGSCGIDILIADLNEIIGGINSGKESYAVLASSNAVICAQGLTGENPGDPAALFGENGAEILADIQQNESGILESVINGNEVYCVYSHVGISDWIMILAMSRDKIVEPSVELEGSIHALAEKFLTEQNGQMLRIVMLWTVVVAAVIVTAVFVIGKLADSISSPIIKLCGAVEKVGGGELKYDCEIKTNDELEKLSDSFRKMTESLNEYIENYARVTADKERISTELNVATQIQADMLPRIFPAFPGRKEFDIFATMTPAKEVGGDFYDFFLIDSDHLAVVMADVSGKGVPAALFMVIAKTLIKNRAQLINGEKENYSPADILSYVNEQLCEGNKADMFVTVWLCIVEISTGKCVAANAGHEYPAIRRAGGEFELVRNRHSPAVAVMEGIKFRDIQFELNPGDSIYVYTDGVPEATDSENQLFGTDRMIAALNEFPDSSVSGLLDNVKKHIDAFVGDAPQFDDITMLCLKYFGNISSENTEG